MARQILPIAGQIIGGMVGGPVGAAIGGAIGGALGAYVDPLRHQGPKLGEARAQTAQEGVYRPLVFGTGCVSGNIIHRSERKVVVHRESAGGKGNRDTVDTERGYRTFAIRIAEAHAPDGYTLLRIWENETLVYDARAESQIPAESAQYSQKFRFYSGMQDQLPDPDLEAYLGVGNVNSYRGSSYIVFGNYDLTDYGDMIPQFRFEVASNGGGSPPSEYWSTIDRTDEEDRAVVLSSGGRNAGAFNSNSTTQGRAGVRGVRSRNSGSWAFEIELVRGINAWAGLLNQGVAVDVEPIPGFLGAYLYANGIKVGDSTTTFSPPLAEGDIVTVLFRNRRIWFKRNGSYIQYNPVDDPGGALSIQLPVGEYCPWTMIHVPAGSDVGDNSMVRLRLYEDQIQYPTFGFTAWGTDDSPGSGFGDPVPLSWIVEFCHRRAGMDIDTFDVSQLDDMVDGVVFADGYSSRDAITTLLPIYNADASEFDDGGGYRIKYVKRGATVGRTLTADDLVDEPEETVREDPMERPRVLHLAFESPITGYTAAKASIQRLSPDVKLVNEVSTYVPVTFKDVDEAWRRADVQMRVAWTEVNGERTFSIADAHLDLIPTDVVAISLRGQVHRLRVQEVEYADGVMKLEAIADRQSNYTSNVTGIPLPAPEPPPPSLMGPAVLAILDIPAISDQNDRLGYYVAVCGTTEAYAGAVIQRQQNGEWADVVSLGRNQRAIMGVLENTVTAGSEHYTDTTNTVSVALYMEDELESLSDAQWLNKGGAFALETAAGWEIMQYRDAHQDSGGVWHLTHLARGRLNTIADEHLPGTRFVLLSGVRFIDADVGMLGQPLTLRAAAVGRSPEGATPHTITYQGNSQREFPVAHLFSELNGAILDMEAVPRDRLGTEAHPLRSVNHDGFRWSATDGVATVTVDTDHATASLDVSGLSAPITTSVVQLNRFTGAGPTVSEQVE